MTPVWISGAIIGGLVGFGIAFVAFVAIPYWRDIRAPKRVETVDLASARLIAKRDSDRGGN